MKRYHAYLFLLVVLTSFCRLWAQPNYAPTLQKERLGRGLVAIRQDSAHVAVTWRLLATDDDGTAFNVYRNHHLLTRKPLVGATFFVDENSSMDSAFYEVRPVMKKKELEEGTGTYTLPAHAPVGYIDIPLFKPDGGVTPAGERYGYTANDASVGDVDGDGEYEIILKWEPTNAHDNAHDGYTGNVLIDCYRLDGEQLWRIDLGPNIRAGAHYTQFMVFDLDGDNRAEVVMRTSDGTIDGQGTVIGDPYADYRYAGDSVRTFRRTPALQGRILTGNEYLTVFSGLTGEALHTIPYVPQRGDPADWGDKEANRSDRFLACVAYLDGHRPSVVMCRGYYTRAVLAAFDWDGRTLSQRWVFDSYAEGNEAYSGQGNHNLRVADIDNDGCDEIIYGSCTIDNDGRGLYSTSLQHGDALHLTAFFPDEPRLQVWQCHESGGNGSSFRDAATGEILFRYPAPMDIGRCMAADIDPDSPGVEMWSGSTGGIRNIRGELIAGFVRGLPTNMAVWWDGDLLRELLDGTRVSKYNPQEQSCDIIFNPEGVVSNNGTKANPCLAADILGDWREEILLRTRDSQSLRLYVSTIPTERRFVTFMDDPVYRISVATQNVAYNQPTQPGFYFGPDNPVSKNK